MKLITPNIYLTDTLLTELQEKQLLGSVNAMSAFLIDCTTLPESVYLQAYTEMGTFLGAVHLEHSPFSNVVTIHPMLHLRDRPVFAEVTEAAILWCLNNHLVPTAQVLDDPNYTYMHEFLVSINLIWCFERQWKTYRLPCEWKPKSFTSYTMEFA